VPLAVTVTSLLFQPLILGPGDAPAVIAGSVWSMSIPVAVAESVFPPLGLRP